MREFGGEWTSLSELRVGQGPGLRSWGPILGIKYRASLTGGGGLLLIGDDAPDVADEESRGPEGKADTPGEGRWEDVSYRGFASVDVFCP